MLTDHIAASLSSLICFDKIDQVEPILTGLSSHCYRVNADNQIFFAKHLPSETEVKISQFAAIKKISPKVFYHDQYWLIHEFIEGQNLTEKVISITDKIAIATKLMTQCHQLAIKPATIDPSNIAHSLINNSHFSTLEQAKLYALARQLTSSLTITDHLVCCHGDINFSNLLIDTNQIAYLVDFECTLLAPAEYDIAMFIAVNNLASNHISTIIKHYNKGSLVEVNQVLLGDYLDFCFFINGLWYENEYQKTALPKFAELAVEQWQHLERFKLPPLLFS